MKPEYKLRRLTLPDFDEKLIAAWEDLEERALEPNAFLSPHFVIPSIKYLLTGTKPFGLFVERAMAGSAQLVGVVGLCPSGPNKRFPLPHLNLCFTKYSFLSGYLVDREYAAEVMGVIFDYLSKPSGGWHTLVSQDRAASGTLTGIEQKTAEARGLKWQAFREWERAAIRFGELPADGNEKLHSRNTRKTIRRRMKYLEELGAIKRKLYYGDTLTAEVMERFLELEHMGWKGEQETSLKSNPRDVTFYREVVTGFSKKNKALFAELVLNDEAIASGLTLTSGNEAFSFKIGWNPKYAQGSPGVLNELRWLEGGLALPDPLTAIDSGAADTAEYMNSLWPHRRSMRSGVYAITPAGRAALPWVKLATVGKKYLNKLRGR
ncbi:MAG: GNAT family N-acetyltransferase [Anaerolineales bacterium]|nr:GNAT family N-acetyltransferase [Anaerolineales bacterium]